MLFLAPFFVQVMVVTSRTVVFKHTKPEDRDSLWGLREKGLESQMWPDGMAFALSFCYFFGGRYLSHA